MRCTFKSVWSLAELYSNARTFAKELVANASTDAFTVPALNIAADLLSAATRNFQLISKLIKSYNPIVYF